MRRLLQAYRRNCSELNDGSEPRHRGSAWGCSHSFRKVLDVESTGQRHQWVFRWERTKVSDGATGWTRKLWSEVQRWAKQKQPERKAPPWISGPSAPRPVGAYYKAETLNWVHSPTSRRMTFILKKVRVT